MTVKADPIFPLNLHLVSVNPKGTINFNDMSKNRKISLAKKNSPHTAEFRRKNALRHM